MVEIYCVYLEVIFTLGVSIWPLPVSLTLLENSMDRNVKTFPDHLYQELFNVKVWCCLKNFLQHFFKMLLKIVNTSLNIYFQITFYKKVTPSGKTTNVLALLYFQQWQSYAVNDQEFFTVKTLKVYRLFPHGTRFSVDVIRIWFLNIIKKGLWKVNYYCNHPITL